MLLADFDDFPAKNHGSLELASRVRAKSGSAKHVEVLFKRKYFSMSPEDGEVSFADDTSPGFRIALRETERTKEEVGKERERGGREEWRRRRERKREMNFAPANEKLFVPLVLRRVRLLWRLFLFPLPPSSPTPFLAQFFIRTTKERKKKRRREGEKGRECVSTKLKFTRSTDDVHTVIVFH